ncbi:MAG TPA: acetyl-CoA carboxylase biotin carboxyl carrier protein [Clostridiales bacterium]|nr:acetyl-CoA carboxylase biotin carboxyl carrier protein [Clostridiales bacterium]
MEYKKILELIHEMNQTDLTKVEIEQEGFRICLEKNSGNVATMQQGNPGETIVQNRNTSENRNTLENNLEIEAPEEFQLEKTQGEKVISPMVGTFYVSSAPENPPFVKVGDKVMKGQTLCIIEAMKLMNEIESDFDGELVKILASNEQMVEFGQPLFIIR